MQWVVSLAANAYWCLGTDSQILGSRFEIFFTGRELSKLYCKTKQKRRKQIKKRQSKKKLSVWYSRQTISRNFWCSFNALCMSFQLARQGSICLNSKYMKGENTRVCLKTVVCLFSCCDSADQSHARKHRRHSNFDKQLQNGAWLINKRDISRTYYHFYQSPLYYVFLIKARCLHFFKTRRA